MSTIVEDVYSQYLRFTVEESAASTFTEGSAILTGASLHKIQGQNVAVEIHAIALELSQPSDSPAAGVTESVTFALSTQSALSSMPELNEANVIYKTQRYIRAGVATYLPLVEGSAYMPMYMEFKHPILISHDKLYPYILSTNSAATAKAYGTIVYTYVLADSDLAIEALEAFR